MSKVDLDCLKKLPSVTILLKDYSFIEDKILARNISNTLQHIIFLILIDSDHNLTGSLTFMIYKDMIIHTASIAESLLNYSLNKALSENKTSLQSLGIIDERYVSYQKYKDISSSEEIGSITKRISYKTPDDCQFIDLISAASKIKLIDANLKAKLNILRDARNKIHLGHMQMVDDQYTKTQVDEMFKTVKLLKDAVKDFFV